MADSPAVEQSPDELTKFIDEILAVHADPNDGVRLTIGTRRKRTVEIDTRGNGGTVTTRWESIESTALETYVVDSAEAAEQLRGPVALRQAAVTKAELDAQIPAVKPPVKAPANQPVDNAPRPVSEATDIPSIDVNDERNSGVGKPENGTPAPQRQTAPEGKAPKRTADDKPIHNPASVDNAPDPEGYDARYYRPGQEVRAEEPVEYVRFQDKMIDFYPVIEGGPGRHQVKLADGWWAPSTWAGDKTLAKVNAWLPNPIEDGKRKRELTEPVVPVWFVSNDGYADKQGRFFYGLQLKALEPVGETNEGKA
jgi:hypothetical protein